MKVAVSLIGKNESEHIESAIYSVFAQPNVSVIVYVDDGSTDDTVERVAEMFRHATIPTKIITRPNRVNGPYLVGQPGMARIVNIAFEELDKHEFDFLYMLNASLYLETGFIESLLKKFKEDPKLVLASGELYVENQRVSLNVPSGSRMVKADYWNWYGRKYPEYYGWEVEIFYTAQRLGYHIAIVPEAKLISLKGKRQNKQNYIHWGRAMRVIGYSVPVTIARGLYLAAKNKKPKILIQLLAGFWSQWAFSNRLTYIQKIRCEDTRTWFKYHESDVKIRNTVSKLISKVI